MSPIQKSESIKASLRDSFRTGTSKLAQRRCYGYDVDANGKLAVNIDEAAVVRWIFDRYLSGDSLGKIVDGLKEQGIPSPTGKPAWNREAISKLLSNEKYTGRVLLQKTISMLCLVVAVTDCRVFVSVLRAVPFHCSPAGLCGLLIGFRLAMRLANRNAGNICDEIANFPLFLHFGTLPADFLSFLVKKINARNGCYRSCI